MINVICDFVSIWEVIYERIPGEHVHMQEHSAQTGWLLIREPEQISLISKHEAYHIGISNIGSCPVVFFVAFDIVQPLGYTVISRKVHTELRTGIVSDLAQPQLITP